MKQNNTFMRLSQIKPMRLTKWPKQGMPAHEIYSHDENRLACKVNVNGMLSTSDGGDKLKEMGNHSYCLSCAPSLIYMWPHWILPTTRWGRYFISIIILKIIIHRKEILRCHDHLAGKYSSQDANTFLPCSNTHILSCPAPILISSPQPHCISLHGANETVQIQVL